MQKEQNLTPIPPDGAALPAKTESQERAEKTAAGKTAEPAMQENNQKAVNSAEIATNAENPAEVQAEQSITEEVQAEQSTTEEVQAEQGTTEEVQVEQGTTEEVQAEQGTTEEVQVEQGTTEEVQAEQSITEEVQAEQSIIEEVQAEQSITEEVQAEQSTIEEVQAEQSITEEVQAEQRTTEEGISEEPPANDVSVEEILEEAAAMEADFVSATEEELDNQAVLAQLFGRGIDDTAERADEVGVTGIFDAYKREVIPPYFENRLRLSVNAIKLFYSRLKNAVLSFRGTSQAFDPEGESYYWEDEEVARVELDGEKLYFFLAAKQPVDRKTYPHKAMTEARYEHIPVRMIVRAAGSLKKAIELFNLIIYEKGAEKRTVFVPVTYAERYPFNPDAVLKGSEGDAPVEGAFDGTEYEPITDENARNITEEKIGKKTEELKGKEKLEDMRQTAKTIKAALALTEPIVYFYDSALDKDSKIAFLNVNMVLTDKFLGRMLPQQYFAIAEGSDKIEELNLIALQDIAEDCKRYPNWKFALQISCRMLSKPSLLKKLFKEIGEIGNFILSFDCAFLEALGEVGLKGINELRSANIDIMIDNAENASMKVLTEYNYQYLRLDARYYNEDDLRKTAHLDVITGFARNQGITTAAYNVGTTKEAKYFLVHGVDVIQGEAVCSPKRIAAVAAKEIRRLPIVT